MSKFSDALQHSWNAFTSRDPPISKLEPPGAMVTSYKPDRVRFTRGNERSTVNAIYNRIAMDCAAIDIQHVRLDANKRFVSTVDSGLNYCLTVEANIDQTARAFKQDIFMSLLDEGCIAVVPIDTVVDPRLSSSIKIETLRTGKITEWMPSHIRVKVYNDRKGVYEEIVVAKKNAAIIENPFYSVMNEPNSTLQRLIRKLNLLDVIDEQSGSGKLDLIVQLPYVIKTEARKIQAESRRKDLEDQLSNSKYGVAYTDGSEHITQLNRPVENNLMKQIEYLTNMLYAQLGLTTSILDGTAKEEERLNYINGTIEPIVSAVTDELCRKFLTKTARSQNQSIIFFREPFKLVPVNQLAEIADKFTRNEIMSSNEIRQVIGMKPVEDPKADELRNKNLNATEDQAFASTLEEGGNQNETMTEEEYLQRLKEFDDFDEELDNMESQVNGDQLKHYASKYYDPVKAHEYYEEHKHLLGRKSTATLNDQGKEAAMYVKKELYGERDSKIADHKSQTENGISTAKETTQNRIQSAKAAYDRQIEDRKTKMKASIESLKSELNALPKEVKAQKKAEYNQKISDLRAENSKNKSLLYEAYKTFRSGESASLREHTSELRTEHSTTKANLRDEYENKYVEELDKLRSDSSMVKQKKEKTSSSTKKSKKSSTESVPESRYKAKEAERKAKMNASK